MRCVWSMIFPHGDDDGQGETLANATHAQTSHIYFVLITRSPHDHYSSLRTSFSTES